MHTVEILEEAIHVAERLGYQVRQEWLGGAGGGACEFGGRRWIFVDLALNTLEQLEQIAEVLREETALHTVPLSAAMSRLLQRQSAA
jgi:hypothetical protein